MLEAKLYHSNYEPHSFQIHTGFKILNDSKIINLRTARTSETVFKRKDLPITVINVGNKRIIYDTLDGYRFDHKVDIDKNLELLDNVLGNCDFYFKRSFSHEYNAKLANKNIFPLGLNYKVYNSLYRDYLEYKFGSKQFGKSIISYSRLFANWFNVEYYKDLHYENLCFPPLELCDYKYKGSILFLTRAWDPNESNLPEDLVHERLILNETRAQCIRESRNAFGSIFIGGFYDTPFARKHYPDLVLPKLYTAKSNYLKLMKRASVCVATTGLHGSIGWKLGEYVACSKVVITEPLHYTVTDEFCDGENYLSCDEGKKMIELIAQTINSPHTIARIMDNNYKYYNNYLRPDKLILQTFKKANILF